MADASSPSSQYPNLNPSAPNDVGSTPPAPNNLSSNVQATMDSIKNSQTVQTIANGPVAEKARVEADNTKNELNNLAASRQTPQTQTATGQSLTHYHSFFYNLLSWENPRATALSYVAITLFIFGARYLPMMKYSLKALYMVLGITAASEIAGKLVLGEGFASKMRPKRYYTIPHETLESVLSDLVELSNFFVIEFQRIMFAENVYVTAAAFGLTLLTYFLIKVMPTWGLALFFTTLIYFVPLAYIQNRELIDHHLTNAQNLVSEQANQVRDLASQHTNKAMEMSQSALKEYSAKAGDLIGQGKKTAVDKGIVSQETADKVTPATTTAEPAVVKSEDFPSAPKLDPAPSEPLKPAYPVPAL